MKRFLIYFFIFLFLLNSFCFADDFIEPEISESLNLLEVSSNISNEPVINSKNVVAVDRKTLSILYEKDCYKSVPMASTTKIMTCLIALENCSLDEIVTVSKKASLTTGSTLGLVENMKISINDLLYGLMLRSGNDCAVCIAEYISGSVEEFSNLMNKKAKELGLSNTNFVTPHGLDNENHYTSAYELALITNYALKNPKFREIVSTKNYTISFNNYPRTISNTNELLGNLNGVYGVKTGFTFNAGRCLVSACKRNDLDIIVVVLGADTKNNRTKDSANIINYIFNTYNYTDISSIINESFENYVTYFENNYLLEKTTSMPSLRLGTLENYEFPFSKNKELNLKTKIYSLNKFSYKTKPNSKIGIIELYNNDKLICSVDIFLENELIKNDWKYYFKNILNLFF